MNAEPHETITKIVFIKFRMDVHLLIDIHRLLFLARGAMIATPVDPQAHQKLTKTNRNSFFIDFHCFLSYLTDAFSQLSPFFTISSIFIAFMSSIYLFFVEGPSARALC